MRRANQLSSKRGQNEFQKIQPHEFDSASATIPTIGKLKKLEDLQSEPRCHSVRNLVGEPKGQDTSRTRSVSPAGLVPPLDAKLPLKKFCKLYSKIVVQLDTVKGFTEKKTNESENLVELRRQLQRADEFSIRFSRNNLYETKRIINEIKQLIVPYPFEGLSPRHCRAICKKIILAFQAATQALQTYINYAKNPSNLEVPEKINELVLLIAELFLCCEHVSLPLKDANVKHDAVKICNELIGLLKSKLPVCEYVELKEADLAKNKTKKPPDDVQKMKKLSMYRTKVTPKLKMEVPKKKIGVPCLLGIRGKKTKKDEKKVKITHEIYTQKLTPWQGKPSGNKIVKFDPENQVVNPEEKKLNLRRPRYVTPREVRSQDDDVETMVQTIGDDEVSTSRLSSTSREIDDDNDMNKTNFKHLLLETIEELQNADKKEQKVTLKKLLNSLQNCSKSQYRTPRPERVKVYHFVSKDFQEEMENNEKEDNEPNEEESAVKQTVEAIVEQEKPQVAHKKTLTGERRLNNVFKPLKGMNSEAAEGEGGPRGRIKLKLSEEIMTNANKYRKAFAEYRKNNIMYKKTLANTPWELVGKVSDRIILDIIEEISMDFENDALLRRLYLNELLEVTS